MTTAPLSGPGSAAFSVARDGSGSVTLSWNTGAGGSGGAAAVAVGACPFWVFSSGAGSDRLDAGRERVSAAHTPVVSVRPKRRRDRRRGDRLRFAGGRFRGRRVLPIVARRRRAVLRGRRLVRCRLRLFRARPVDRADRQLRHGGGRASPPRRRSSPTPNKRIIGDPFRSNLPPADPPARRATARPVSTTA